MKIVESYSLSPHNTFGLEATAAYFIEVATPQEVQLLSKDEYFRTLPFIVIGGGSNLLFRGDFKGAVIHYTGKALTKRSETPKEVVFNVEAAFTWNDLVLHTTSLGLWGAENLALIPGEVGAAAVQNIGAYGVEIQELVQRIHCIDLKSGEALSITKEEAEYGYRHSIFKETNRSHLIVTSVDLSFSKEPKPKLEYKGLESLQETLNLTPSEVATYISKVRENKLPDPKTLGNAGSFFMNPLISEEHFLRLQSKYPAIPFYKMEKGVKIPAAWLIEQAGLKGFKKGNVGTYPLQPLVIVNYGGATGREISDLADLIMERVRTQFEVTLTPEVRYIKSAELDSVNELM